MWALGLWVPTPDHVFTAYQLSASVTKYPRNINAKEEMFWGLQYKGVSHGHMTPLTLGCDDADVRATQIMAPGEEGARENHPRDAAPPIHFHQASPPSQRSHCLLQYH